MPQSVSSAVMTGRAAARFARGRPIGRPFGRLAFAEVGEHESHVLARREAPRGHLAREVRILGGYLDALPAAVEFPAVIQAAQRIAFDPAEVQRRPAMRTAVVEDLRAS